MSKQTEITATAKRSHETVIAKAPKLRSRDDAASAKELDDLIKDAEAGTIKILKAGFFVECIAADLPKGQLTPWLKAWCPHREPRTVRRWKQTAADLAESHGLAYKLRTKQNYYQYLNCPLAEVPAPLKKYREKFDADVAGKSYRQLFIKFSQAEDAEDDDSKIKPKRGRLKGHGGASAEQRAAAQARDEAARIEALELDAESFCKWLDENSDDKHLGLIHDAPFNTLLDSLETAVAYMRTVRAARRKEKGAQ